MVDGRHSTRRAVKEGRATLAEGSELTASGRKRTPGEAKSRVSKKRAASRSVAKAKKLPEQDESAEVSTAVGGTPAAEKNAAPDATVQPEPATQPATEARPPPQDDLPLREDPGQTGEAPSPAVVEQVVTVEPNAPSIQAPAENSKHAPEKRAPPPSIETPGEPITAEFKDPAARLLHATETQQHPGPPAALKAEDRGTAQHDIPMADPIQARAKSEPFAKKRSSEDYLTPNDFAFLRAHVKGKIESPTDANPQVREERRSLNALIGKAVAGKDVKKGDIQHTARRREDDLSPDDFEVVRARMNGETEPRTSEAEAHSEAPGDRDAMTTEPMGREADEAESRQIEESQQVAEHGSPPESDGQEADGDTEIWIEPPAESSLPTPPTKSSQLPGLHLVNTPPPDGLETAVNEVSAPPAAITAQEPSPAIIEVSPAPEATPEPPSTTLQPQLRRSDTRSTFSSLFDELSSAEGTPSAGKEKSPGLALPPPRPASPPRIPRALAPTVEGERPQKLPGARSRVPKRNPEDTIFAPDRSAKVQRREELHAYDVFGHNLPPKLQGPWAGTLLRGGPMVTELLQREEEAAVSQVVPPPVVGSSGDGGETRFPEKSAEDEAILAGLKAAAEQVDEQESDADESSTASEEELGEAVEIEI